jgi:mannose-binding lectin 1
MTPKASSRGVLKNPLPLDYDSWTIEAVFRSVGAHGPHGGAFALKYAVETTRNVIWDKFDGLQVVVDTNSNMGSAVHAFLDDDTVDLSELGENKYDAAFGSCLLNYQDSQVPTTLRISYYNGYLVIQANNRICVKTNKVKLPFGHKISVLTESGSVHEQFELLRLKTYAGVISEVSDNDGLSAAQPKVVTEFVQLDDMGEEVNKIEVDKSASKKTEVHTSDILEILDNVQKSNKEIIDQFSSMQSKILALSSGSSGSNDFSYLDDQNKKIKQLHNEIMVLSQKIDTLDGNINSFNAEINKVVSVVNRLNNDNVNQLRDNEHSITELSKKVDYLVLSEKEREANPVHDVINGLKYLLLPVLLTTFGLCFFAFRLRHDIKTKLL